MLVFTQCCVQSTTLFLLHINDMLQISSIHCYVDDSKGDALYTVRTNISCESVIESRNKLLSETEISLEKVSEGDRLNLVHFNLTKTQICAFIAKKLVRMSSV